MITCKLQGGLGNQLFQIATTAVYAWKQRIEPVFDFDSCSTRNQGRAASEYKFSLYRQLLTGDVSLCTNIYKEQSNTFSSIPDMEDVCLEGYFQSPKYFDDYRKEVRNMLSFNSMNLDRVHEFLLSLGNNSVTVVHMRRGDYTKWPDVYHLCSEDYYHKAMGMLSYNQFVFCAIPKDMEWVKEHFFGDNIHYSPFTDEIDDLTLMILANNIIMANSTFSWWGAYLNPNPDKVVIAPKLWYKELSSQDIYCDSWQLI